MKDINESKIG